MAKQKQKQPTIQEGGLKIKYQQSVSVILHIYGLLFTPYTMVNKS